MRLDTYLSEHNFYKSRARAASAIEAGCVRVNGKVMTKCSVPVNDDDLFECLPDPIPYVSRGGLKLEGALSKFQIDVHHLHCLDIGSSTGGFTHVLLERGASSVTCIDVGRDQLDPVLRQDLRVTLYECTDARTFRPGVQYAFICMDVSFISATQIIETIRTLLTPEGQAVILIKPQFELGRKALNKNGIVKSKEVGRLCAQEIATRFCVEGDFILRGIMESPIKGGDGNIEYCAWFCRK